MISYVIYNRLGHLLIDYNTECDNKDNNNKKEMYVSRTKKKKMYNDKFYQWKGEKIDYNNKIMHLKLNFYYIVTIWC